MWKRISEIVLRPTEKRIHLEALKQEREQLEKLEFIHLKRSNDSWLFVRNLELRYTPYNTVSYIDYGHNSYKVVSTEIVMPYTSSNCTSKYLVTIHAVNTELSEESHDITFCVHDPSLQLRLQQWYSFNDCNAKDCGVDALPVTLIEIKQGHRKNANVELPCAGVYKFTEFARKVIKSRINTIERASLKRIPQIF